MRLILLFLSLIIPIFSQSWGFFAHRKINRLAVFTLPPEMIVFYKQNIQYITEKAVNPDMRRYAVKNEAPKHYIDIDVYGDSAVYKMPRYWDEAVEKYTEDTLQAYGIVPYHINRMTYWLIKAFQEKNADQILRLSSDMGHYIADANVPLHTTENYNGQFSGQYGIHGFWESRLPELFSDDYDLLTGKAEYVENLQLYAWDAVVKAHEALDSVLLFEKQLTKRYPESKKYGYEERGNTTIRTYSYDFSKDYHRKLNGMVERRMRASIKMVGDFWFSCWVKAGQPDLSDLLLDVEFQDSTFVVDPNMKLRNHEAGIGE
ncbi:zinc dependent phospholipase C family protein [Ekhidna sp. MALMAid0563]|uniref:zinc dependent phospholipase C family protein n=1 Tax=Ekhidna sp. MALMAid0563 TaxID=3143937 RepID=UPI0032DF1FE1